MEIFPSKLRELWNNLELRILVLISLFLQIVLISTGNRRKYTRRKWVSVILWLSYLSADAIATIALGVLSQAAGDIKKSPDQAYVIKAFWAPFLLAHLGGPDTITAYALADNELWSRHLLGLVGQVIVAIYVFLISWMSSPLNYLWLVVFVTGLVKYLERTWVLFCASRDQFREAIVSLPDPGPNYAKFMAELVSKEREGFKVSLGKAIEDGLPPSMISAPVDTGADAAEGTMEDAYVLHNAYYFFRTFRQLFADLILSFQDKETSLSFFRTVSWDKAFSIVEVELGLIYDLFYTKAFFLYTWHGFFFRLLTWSSTIAAFFAFLIIDKTSYPQTEVTITYILFAGAIFIEIYAVLIFLASDRVMIWLSGDWASLSESMSNLKDHIVMTICKIVSMLRCFHILPARMRWSDAIGQYNVLDCCLESAPKFPKLHLYLERFLFLNSVSIPKSLKGLIFDEIKVRATSGAPKNSGSYRGDRILLREMKCYDMSDEVEFDQSILLWHLATDFCYKACFDDGENEAKDEDKWPYELNENEESCLDDILKFKRESCRLLSNYMMHLLVVSPFMLPGGIGQIRFQDTRAEVVELLDRQQNIKRREACKIICQVDTRFAPNNVKGDRSKSLLFDACRLHKSLQSLEVHERWDKISEAWLDILTFAAAQCAWNAHAEKLSQGGELLTHVWLLMAHFGMTDQFQISQGYVRAKLNLE